MVLSPTVSLPSHLGAEKENQIVQQRETFWLIFLVGSPNFPLKMGFFFPVSGFFPHVLCCHSYPLFCRGIPNFLWAEHDIGTHQEHPIFVNTARSSQGKENQIGLCSQRSLSLDVSHGWALQFIHLFLILTWTVYRQTMQIVMPHTKN